MSDFKLYTPCNWFDVEKLCSDDVQYHDKKNLLVDYESFEQLTQTNKELEQARLDEMALKAKAREQRDEMTAKVKELEEKLKDRNEEIQHMSIYMDKLEEEVKTPNADIEVWVVECETLQVHFLSEADARHWARTNGGTGTSGLKVRQIPLFKTIEQGEDII